MVMLKYWCLGIISRILCCSGKIMCFIAICIQILAVFEQFWQFDGDFPHKNTVITANRQYLAQMVGVGGMGFVVGKK